MKSVVFNLKLLPAAENGFSTPAVEPVKCSKKQRIQAVSMHLLRLVVIFILLYSVMHF